MRDLLGETSTRTTLVFIPKQQALKVMKGHKPEIFNALNDLLPQASFPGDDDQSSLLNYISTKHGSIYSAACSRLHRAKVGEVARAADRLDQPMATKWLTILCNGDVTAKEGEYLDSIVKPLKGEFSTTAIGKRLGKAMKDLFAEKEQEEYTRRRQADPVFTELVAKVSQQASELSQQASKLTEITAATSVLLERAGLNETYVLFPHP